MSKVKKNTHRSEEVSSSSGTSSSISSDEEVDASDLKPIKDYLSDRRELARQLFKSVKAEKIQMMLPQVLKKMDLGQLETLCATELSGMSKNRILSILNGKPMVESSDTSESDDSGPSLEIISDTEEWFTDEEVCLKEEGSIKGKVKKDRLKQKGKSQFHKKGDSKSNHKRGSDNVSKNASIQKEESVETSKEKEGDSLLDLLELEMRARAIRALIRKEEDIIPNTSKSTDDDNASNKNVRAEQEMKDKENCRRQLEKIISAQQSNIGEDEDVVLVVQPTPTIELLSSDSEDESHNVVRVNKKLENERTAESKNNVDRAENKDATNIISEEKTEENKATKNASEVQKESDAHKAEVSKRPHSNNISHKDAQSKSAGKRRKTKKRSHTKEQPKNVDFEVHNKKSCNDSQNAECIKKEKTVSQGDEKSNGEGNENDMALKLEHSKSLPNKQDSVDVSGVQRTANLDEEKSIDLDEIIDLDDYCDDMEDMENNENEKNKGRQTADSKQNTNQGEVNSAQKANGTETWASRYYQTDDVQNVIKESKIQSEIRKRLRERQRLSKTNTFPNKKFQSSSATIEATNKVTEKNPLGSVDEYLALKHTAASSLSTDTANDNSSLIKDNETSASADANKLIENDNANVHCKIKNIGTNVGTSHNVNVEKTIVTKDEKVANLTNPN